MHVTCICYVYMGFSASYGGPSAFYGGGGGGSSAS